MKLGSPEEQTAMLQEAEKNLKEAIRLNPSVLPAYLNLALVYEELGQKDNARDAFSALIDQPESDSDKQAAYLARLKRGNIYFEAGQNQLAVVDYQDAINLSPSPIGYFNLGQTHARLGQAELALDAFHHAIRLNSKYLEAYQRMGEVALQLKRYNEAIDAYSREIKIHQDGGNLAGQMVAHLNLGRAYRLSGNRNQEAQKEFKIAGDLSSKLSDDAIYTTISYEMGLTHYAAREMDKAADIFANSAEIFDIDGKPIQSIEARIYLARALKAQGETAEALQELDLAQEQLDKANLNPANPEVIRLNNEIALLRPTLTQ
jgi:tetratricopeptide (TPR) repeat protein